MRTYIDILSIIVIVVYFIQVFGKGVVIMNQSNKNDTVKNYIKDKIQRHIYTEGQIIESESRLCDILQVSRMTVRKALDELVGEGIVYKEKGRGTFISKKPKYAEFRCGVGFSQEIRKKGMVPSTREATLELITADYELAEKLNIQELEPVWKVTRVRCADGQPVTYAEEYYLYALCPELTLDIVNQSIYDYLEEKGIVYACLDQKLEAVGCPEDIAEKLEVDAGYPLIFMSLIVYQKNGIAYNCSYEYCRTDKFTFTQSIYHE